MDLPHTVLDKITSHLTAHDIVNLCCTCKTMKLNVSLGPRVIKYITPNTDINAFFNKISQHRNITALVMYIDEAPITVKVVKAMAGSYCDLITDIKFILTHTQTSECSTALYEACPNLTSLHYYIAAPSTPYNSMPPADMAGAFRLESSNLIHFGYTDLAGDRKRCEIVEKDVTKHMQSAGSQLKSVVVLDNVMPPFGSRDEGLLYLFEKNDAIQTALTAKTPLKTAALMGGNILFTSELEEVVGYSGNIGVVASLPKLHTLLLHPWDLCYEFEYFQSLMVFPASLKRLIITECSMFKNRFSGKEGQDFIVDRLTAIASRCPAGTEIVLEEAPPTIYFNRLRAEQAVHSRVFSCGLFGLMGESVVLRDMMPSKRGQVVDGIKFALGPFDAPAACSTFVVDMGVITVSDHNEFWELLPSQSYTGVHTLYITGNVGSDVREGSPFDRWFMSFMENHNTLRDVVLVQHSGLNKLTMMFRLRSKCYTKFPVVMVHFVL